MQKVLLNDLMTYAQEFAVRQHALLQASGEEINMILHQLIHCTFGTTGRGLVVGIGS